MLRSSRIVIIAHLQLFTKLYRLEFGGIILKFFYLPCYVYRSAGTYCNTADGCGADAEGL